MKKRLLSLIAVMCVATFVLAACGGGGGNTSTTAAAGGEAATEAAGGEAATEAAASGGGETYDVGDFTFTLPSGWQAFPQEDFFGDEDADGNKPIDPALIYVSKDAKSDFELLDSPYVMINYYPASTTLMSSKDFYENVEDLDVTVQGKAADEAYKGESGIIEGWSYQIIQFTTDNAQFMVTIPDSLNGNPGYAYTDPDVVAILESLQGK